jgi:hypothetical protein
VPPDVIGPSAGRVLPSPGGSGGQEVVVVAGAVVVGAAGPTGAIVVGAAGPTGATVLAVLAVPGTEEDVVAVAAGLTLQTGLV